MTYDEIIEQLEITKTKIKEIARNEYGGESWNDDLDALTEAADIVADYSKATAQASLNQLMLAIYGKNMLGYTSDRLIRYGLPVKWHVVKKNRFRVIDIDAFWKWAEDNKSILDFSRFEKYSLGAEPDWVDVKRKADYKKLQLHGQHNAAWTKTEDDKLRYLLSKGTYTYSDLAAELRHSEGAIKRRILDLGINKKPVRCPPKMDGGRSGNLVPYGRRRLRFRTDRREAEPDSAGHSRKIRAAAESGI